jgi:large subunit ribosomal protein L23
VRRDASKPVIKQAVEKMFNVQVESVTVTNVKGKEKKFGKTPGRRQDWKKAYVRLKPGQDINFAGVETK